jgi:hypothetical protein
MLLFYVNETWYFALLMGKLFSSYLKIKKQHSKGQFTDNQTSDYGSRDSFRNVVYEGESVNRPQMDIKHKTHDIRNWKKHLFLEISSTNIDTIVPSLYQCVATRSIEVI